MKTNYLFPNQFKLIGWILAIPSGLSLLLWMITDSPLGEDTFLEDFFYDVAPDWFLTFLMTLFGIGLLFAAFSKEKQEDEYIRKIRGDSLIWAVLIYAILFIMGTILFYELNYVLFMGIQLYVVLVLFIIKFNIALHQLQKSSKYEK